MTARLRRLATIASIMLLLLWVSLPGHGASDQTTPATPGVIYIIRHAEKPDSSDDSDLTPQGVERAKALATAFPAHFQTPDFIFATAPSTHRNRPMETVAPLAEALHLKPADPFAEDEVDKLAKELLTQPKYAGKTILIAWHHGAIPALAKALGAKNVPDKWPDDTFDRVWKLTFTAGAVQFENLPQRTLPGDSEK